MEEPLHSSNLTQSLQLKYNADIQVSSARELDEQRKFPEALALYTSATDAYVSLMDSFMLSDVLTDEENVLVEEISAKLTPIANRADELRALQQQAQRAMQQQKDQHNEQWREPQTNIPLASSFPTVPSHMPSLTTTTSSTTASNASPRPNFASTPSLIFAFPSTPEQNDTTPTAQDSTDNNTNSMANNSVTETPTATDSSLSLVLNIAKVICWQIDPVTKERKMIADGKYPLKVFIYVFPILTLRYFSVRIHVNCFFRSILKHVSL